MSRSEPPDFKRKLFVAVHQNKGHGIGGVIGVRTTGVGIDHHFGVAVIGGDEPRASAAFSV